MNKRLRYFITAVAMWMCASLNGLSAQQAAAPFPLPDVPEALTDFTARTDFVVEHYWDRAQLSKKFSNNKAMLTTFSNYLDLLPHATRSVAIKSIGSMMEQLKKNPTGMELIVDQAIRDLYGDSALYISDEVLMRFLKPAAANKKISKEKRQEYKQLLVRITSSMQNGHAPMVAITNADGSQGNLSDYIDNDTTTIKILYLVNPDDDGFMLQRIRMAADSRLNNLIRDGVFKFIALYPAAADSKWAAAIATMPEEWIKVAVPEGDKSFDLRVYPCLYIVDTNGFIRNKNLTVDDFLNWIYSL